MQADQMTVIHAWTITDPNRVTGRDFVRRSFRLLSQESKEGGTIYAIEHCERDRSGAERWVDVADWLQKAMLKNDSPTALLAEALVGLIAARDPYESDPTAKNFGRPKKRTSPQGDVTWESLEITGPALFPPDAR